MPALAPPRRPPVPPRPAWLALALAGTIALGAGCSVVGDTGAAGDPTVPTSAASASDQADVLPDPGVAPGACARVVASPPSATLAPTSRLCRPSGAQRDVAVLLVHGGGGTGGSHEGMGAWADRLLDHGYVVLQVGYELFEPGGPSPVFPRPEQDVKAAVQFVRGAADALGVARDRVVVQGMSAGARLGAVAYTTPDDPAFQGEELWPGVSDAVDGFVGFYHPYDGSMQHSAQYYGGPAGSADPEVAARWALADALANADRVVGPALLITGSEDWELIDEHQERLAQHVRATGQRATTIVIDGGGHGFDEAGGSLSRLGDEAADEVLAWLETSFPPGAAADDGG